jgi:transcriptional regulator with XRE-family HTH domain
MGRGSRLRPARLAEKLLTIRQALGLSQTEMLHRLGYGDEFTRTYVSGFETGVREPPLPVLLAYARVMGVSTDVLIDDSLDLPAKLLSGLK